MLENDGMNLLVRLLIKALAFVFLLPMVPGIHMHGGFMVAVGLAIFFSVMQWVVELVAMALSAYLAISTLGMALLLLIPMWLLGFWLLPAMALKLVADFMPEYLAVSGWMPAVLGGLILFVVGMITTNLGEIRNRTARA
jgi:uncharacterized membrane protein YvlD (DUF360 family)